jgi:hypothetical protein
MLRKFGIGLDKTSEEVILFVVLHE